METRYWQPTSDIDAYITAGVSKTCYSNKYISIGAAALYGYSVNIPHLTFDLPISISISEDTVLDIKPTYVHRLYDTGQKNSVAVFVGVTNTIFNQWP